MRIISRSNSDNNFIDTSDKSLEDQFNKDGGTGKAKSFWRFFSIPLQKLNLLEPYQNFGFDKIKIDAESIARKAFDVPAEIYGEANSKYENLSAAEKMFITNTCQPLLDIIFSSIAKYYDKKIIIKSDFSFMPCFAVDKKDTALELKTISETIKILTDAGKQAEADLLTKKYFV